MIRILMIVITAFFLAGNAHAMKYMQTDIMKVSSTPSLVAIPTGVGTAYNGKIWDNGDKYSGFSFNMDLRSYFQINANNMFFTDLSLSSGFDSPALSISPYLKTGFGMVHRLTPRISITGYMVPKFMLGGSVSETPWVNEFRGIVRYFSYATARPWSEYQGVEVNNHALYTVNVNIKF